MQPQFSIDFAHLHAAGFRRNASDGRQAGPQPVHGPLQQRLFAESQPRRQALLGRQRRALQQLDIIFLRCFGWLVVLAAKLVQPSCWGDAAVMVYAAAQLGG